MERRFRGIWIPAEIWMNDQLTLQEKVFLVEIDSLDRVEECFASNGHFSTMFGLTKSRCSQVIKSLEKKGFISIAYEYQGKEIAKRIISPKIRYVIEEAPGEFREFDTPIKYSKEGSEKIKEGIKFSKNPPLGNAKGINTSIIKPVINTTNNKDTLPAEEAPPVKPKKKDILTDEIKEAVLNKWNEQGAIQAKGWNTKRCSALRARIKEYGLETVLEVIGVVGKNSFLKGENDRRWKASIDFILKPDKFQFAWEGGYPPDEGGKSNGSTTSYNSEYKEDYSRFDRFD